ncbi:hypothetical protein MMC15_007359 [Xylographa vitiligo]|nr:hypothetical protein [Xylographa vitiligo]
MNSILGFSPTTPQHTASSTASTFSSAPNTGWATPATSYPTSAQSNKSGGWPARNFGQSIKSPPAEMGSRTTPGKLSIVSPVAVVATKSAAVHAKLHKRDSSSSSIPTPRTAAFPAFDPSYQDFVSPPAIYHDSYAPPSPATSIRSKVKIKPLLRKLQPQEKTSLDLSRSAAENEGLGIYTSSNTRDGRGSSDASGGRRGYHTRTTSGTSQLSSTTTSSTHRSGSQYVHPMRQTPRPFTPPPVHSQHPSLANSDLSSTHTPDRPQLYRYTSSSNPSSYAPLPTLKRTPPPLHIRTHSSSRLTSSSQTNLPGTPSSLRYADTFSPSDPMPLTARSSFDAFHKRSRTDTATDPAVQLAAVQALRAEFNAREAAKDLKIKQAAERLQQKDARKQEKRDESARRKSEAQERKRTRSTNASEKSVPLSTEYTQTLAAPMEIDFDMEAQEVKRPKRGRTATAGSAGKAVGSQWSLFWFRFKTMWLKFKRSMSRGS